MRRDDKKKPPTKKISRKQAEQESLLWYFERMDQVNRAMQGTNDLEQAMKDILDTLLAVFECDRAWLVYPCDPEAATWQVPMERTTPEYPSVLPIGMELPLDPVGAEVYRKLRATEGPVKFGPDFEDQVPTVIAQAFHVKSFIAMAFYPKIGKPWSFGLHQCSYARTWTPEEERLFQEIGRRLSDTLTSLLAYRNLQESEGQIKQLIDASPVAMVVSSGMEEHVEWVNGKFIELFGYTTEDMPDAGHWWPLAYPDETYRKNIKAQWDANVERAIREKSQIKPMEATVRCKDGSHRHVEFRLSSIGEKHLVTFVDLTEHKRMEEALSTSEAELRTLISAMTDVIFVGNSEGRFLKIVDTNPSLLYKPSKELLGKTLHEVFPTDLADFFLNHLRQALNTQKSVDFEYSLPIGDKKMWFYATASPMTNDKTLMVARDITDRKQAEDALRESEERYRHLVNLSPDGISIHSQGRILFVNPAMMWMSGGTSADQLVGKSVLDLVHPDSREFVRKRIDEMQATGQPISFIEEKLLRVDGSSFDVELAAVPYSFKGTQYIQIVARDITERKRAEAQLLASEQLFRALVENSPDFIARYDREFRRIYVNPAIQKLFGVQVENVLGKTPSDQSPVYAPQIYIDHLRQVIEAGTESGTEMPFLTGKGEMHWGHMRFVPEFGPEGQVESVLAIGRDIHEIKENERRFRMLAENFPDLVMRFDREGRYIYVNAAFEKAFGMTAESVIGKTLQELLPHTKTEPDDAPLARIRRAFDEGVANETEVRWDTEKGERIIENRYVPEKDAAGNVVTVLCIARDLTERKQAEDALREHEGHSQSLLRLSRKLEQAQTYSDVLNAAQDEVRDIIGYQNLWAYLFTPDKKQAKALFAKGPMSDRVMSEDGTGTITIQGDRMMEEFLETTEIMVVEDAQIDERTDKKIAAKMGNRTLVHVPILLFDRHMGSVGMGTFGDEGVRIPTASEREYLTALASHIAVTFDRIHLLEKRQQVEQELIIREREYRVLVENIPDLIVRYDTNLRRIYVNPAWERASGLSAEDVVNVPYTDIPRVPSPVNDEYLEKLQQALTSGTPQAVEFTWVNAHGGTLFLEYVIVPEYDRHGNISGVLSVGHDITARKKAEVQLLASEQLFRALVENSPDFIARYDREFRRIYVNPAIQKLFGTSPENMLGKMPADQPPVYTPQIYMDHLKRVIETGAESVTEMPFRTAEGEMHWSHMRFVPEFGPEGQVESVLHIGRDIHEIKENERRFRMLAENFPDLVMRFDREGRYIYINPAFEKAVGMPAESIIGKTLQELPQRIKTEQNKARLASIRRALAEGIAHESEVRWDTEKGERIFEDRYVPERDATGNVVTVLCIARDVTEQKRAEEELQKTNDLLRAIIEAAPTAIIGLDLEGKVQNVWNPAAEKMLGWSAEDAMGNYLPSVPIDKEDEFRKFRDWIRSGKIMDGKEAQRRRRDGTLIDYSIYASPLHDAQGQITGNIAVLVDITERKRVEQALRESEERYRLIAENTADTIAVFDLNLRPTYISPSIKKLRGYSVQEALAQSLDQMLTPESLHRAQKVFADQMALEASGEADPSRASLLELEQYRKDGSVIWVELAASFLRDENSQPTGILTVTRDITERKRAEDDLRASETRFRILVDHAADAFFLYDEQGTILDVNRQACESLGYSRHELIGMTPYEIDSMLDHSFIGQLESRLDAGETVAFETRHRRKDGSVFPVEVRGRPFWHGERRFAVALARDITERKQAEEQRKDHVRFLESMDKVNRAMQSANDIEWVMNDVLDLVLSIFDCDRAYLGYPCDPETPSWSLRAESTRPEYPGVLALGIDEVPIDPEGTEIFRILLNTDGPVTFGPGNSHPLSANATNRFGLQSFMSMAFFPKVGKPWQFGIHQCSYARVWTPEDERLFHEIGRRLSDVLTVLLTYRHLQESEERYRQLVNLSPDGISIHSDGRVQFVNPAMVHMSGATSADQLIGKSALDGIHPDFREVARNRIHEMESTGQPIPFIEEKLLRLDGSSIDVELAAVPYNINNTSYIQVVARDITERKRAEEALRESEERLRQIASSLREVVWLRDVQTRQVLYVNPAFQELTGRTCESFYENRNIMIDAVHPDDKAWVIKALSQRFESVPFDREHRIIHLDGSVRWVSSRIFPVRNKAGDVYRSASIMEDITERKHHELEREAIITVSSALRKATTRAEILTVLLDQLVELFDAEGSMIALPNPVDKGFIIERGRGTVGERFTGLIIPPGKGVTGWVIESKQPYLNNRADIDSRVYRPDLLGGSHCVASVPLIAREQSIGALWIVRHTNILERDLRLLNAVADIAANALHRVILHEQTEQQLHHLMALHQIDLAISANFDLNVTLKVILQNVKAELEVDASSILLLDPVTHTLDYAAGIGFRTRSIEGSHVRLGHGYAGRAAQEHCTISGPDLRQTSETFSRSALLANEGFLSHYATPLVIKGQVKGVLEIFHRTPFVSDKEWIDYFETLATQAAIAIESTSLFENLQRSNMELMLAYDATIEGWSRALDLRDKETEGHTQRVTEMVLDLAEKMGMSDAEKIDLRRGALLHDIGKMGVPDAILLKPGTLSNSEQDIMRQHPFYAFQMLSPIPYLKRALEIPYYHHERWDGSGYPHGLKGEEIPLSARMFAVVDVFDALTSDRPYRAAWTREKAYRYIQEQAGRHLDPQIVKIFLEGI